MHTTPSMRIILHRLMICLALLAAQPTLATESDPPGRVGRISLAGEGTQLRIGDSSASGSATLNWPLTTGALIETTGGARSEGRIGSTVLRIYSGTVLEFLELSDERIWLRLGRGSVAILVENPEHAAEMALDTPQGRLRFDGPGIYRADVAGGTTAFSAYRGSATIEELGLAVRAGERVLLLGGNDRKYLLGQAAHDAFGQWALAREQNNARPANHFVSPEMTGHETLDQYGRWQETAEYGAAWFPSGVASGWAPYRSGRWAWVLPWGWTWIDQAPWGFAPFHYGRWTIIGNQWAWLPGVYAPRPVYAPALVAWHGQPGWNLSFSFGTAPAAGWYPLGPREIYYPHYRSSLRHVRHVNVSHVRQVSRIVTVTPPAAGYAPHHVHRHRHEAITVAPQIAVQPGLPLERSATPPRSRPATPAAASPSVPDHQRLATPAQPWLGTAPSAKQDLRSFPTPAGSVPVASRMQAAAGMPSPSSRRIEAPKVEHAPALPANTPHKAEARSVSPSGPLFAPPPPQRQTRYESGHEAAPRAGPPRQEHIMGNKREPERSEPVRPRHVHPDRIEKRAKGAT